MNNFDRGFQAVMWLLRWGPRIVGAVVFFAGLAALVSAIGNVQ